MKVFEKFWKTVVIVLTANLLLIATTINVFANPTTFTIIQPGNAQLQTGKTYGEWSVSLWKYLSGIPLNNNPIFDPTGENCNFAQTGSVFFLVSTAGGSVTRNECRVPAGKVLFFSPLTIASLKLVDQQPELSLRNYNQSFIESTREIQVSIDGTQINTLVSFEPHTMPFLRAASPDGFFTILAPENNIFGVVPGQSYQAVADGFYLLVAPLSPGAHTIKFGGISRNFAADATYNLIVEP